jgi:hypothetical protein
MWPWVYFFYERIDFLVGILMLGFLNMENQS